MEVQFGFCEQLVTSFWKQFMANWTKKLQLQDPFIMLSRTSIGDEKPTQYSLVETLNKKWPKNESNSEDDKYELPILKCGANQCALVKHKKRTLE